ncbi:MAG: N-acetyltransferase family protein [Pseudomonadota bacterium]
MTVRRAEARDASALAAIWNHYIRDTTVTFTTDEKSVGEVADYIAARQTGGTCVFVAEAGSDLTGFAAASSFRSGPGYAGTLETTVMLAEGASGGGLGRALMVAVEGHAQAHAMRALVAGISGDNEAAVGFHAALGFDEVGRMPGVGRKFDRWLDLVLMQKTL